MSNDELNGLLKKMFPKLPEAVRADYLRHLSEAMTEYGIIGPKRVAAFLAQIGHESRELTCFEENLNYSAEALRRTWPKHFSTDEIAAQYAHKREAIANRAYANRNGNGPESSGDGYRYRGRGAIQLTGRDNYRNFGKLLGLDLAAIPDLVLTPAVAFAVAGAFFEAAGCCEAADEGDFVGITLRINGGLNGQGEREALYERAKAALAAA